MASFLLVILVACDLNWCRAESEHMKDEKELVFKSHHNMCCYNFIGLCRVMCLDIVLEVKL